MGDRFLAAGVAFGRSVVGITTRPYETYRRVVRGSLWELVYIGTLIAVYCFVSRIQVAPVLLTYALTIGLFWAAARAMGSREAAGGFSIGWGYTLVPTLIWFITTTVLYVLLPPPRTTSFYGILFSTLYLLFSATLLFWKVTLAYLSLRFGMKLDLVKISMVSAIVLPILALYSVGMYRLGIFRIPFL